MKKILMILLVMALISLTQGHHINLSTQEKPKVINLSGVSFSDFLNWTAATKTPFEWNNPKFPKINVTDTIINKDIYTDIMYNYLHNWSAIVPLIPRA